MAKRQPDYMYKNWLLRLITISIPPLIWIIWALNTEGWKVNQIPTLDLFLLGLASFRITRLLSLDAIAEFLRGPFVREYSFRTSLGVFKVDQEPRSESMLRYHIGEILSCYWCLGVWVSFFLVVGYLYIPKNFYLPFLLFLSVAGLQAIFDTLARFMLQGLRWFNREPEEEGRKEPKHHESF